MPARTRAGPQRPRGRGSRAGAHGVAGACVRTDVARCAGRCPAHRGRRAPAAVSSDDPLGRTCRGAREATAASGLSPGGGGARALADGHQARRGKRSAAPGMRTTRRGPVALRSTARMHTRAREVTRDSRVPRCCRWSASVPHDVPSRSSPSWTMPLRGNHASPCPRTRSWTIMAGPAKLGLGAGGDAPRPYLAASRSSPRETVRSGARGLHAPRILQSTGTRRSRHPPRQEARERLCPQLRAGAACGYTPSVWASSTDC